MATADEYATWIVNNADKKGTPEFDIVAKAYQSSRQGSPVSSSATNVQQSKSFGQQLSDTISDIPRQVGLTARHGIEGVGGVIDTLATPIRAGINLFLPEKYQAQPGTGNRLADSIGLPVPRNSAERLSGDVARTMAGAAVPIGIAGQAAKVTSGATQGVYQALSANPVQQLVSAGASGGAGGYVKENGGNELGQVLASLAAGVAAPVAYNAIQKAGTAVKSMVPMINGKSSSLSSQTLQPSQIDIQINNALKPSGITLADLSEKVQASIRRDVADALDTGGNLSPEAVRRLADYRLVGATPTAGKLTRDPAQFTREENLMRIGANSKDKSAQQLGLTKNANNNQMINGLNDLGANTIDTPIAGGRRVMAALDARDMRAKSLINDRYAAARATDGRSAALDPYAFTNQANNSLDEALLGGKLPADVRNLLNKAATGEMPLTVDTAEQFKTRIGDLQRSTTDMAERKALGLVRQALDNTPLLEGQGQQAIDAFNKARGLNRAYMQIVEKTPALQAVRDGIEPDKFVQQFIVGNGSKSNVSDLSALRQSIKANPDAMAAVKEQIVSHLKAKALNGAADEVGSISQSGYNKALNAIGDEKLSMFFTKPEVDQLKAIGRVASYEQVAPSGAFPNRSNTAGAIAGLFDMIGSSSILRKIPLGSFISEPAQNISIGIKSAKALNVPNALIEASKPSVSNTPNAITNALMISPLGYDQKTGKKK